MVCARRVQRPAGITLIGFIALVLAGAGFAQDCTVANALDHFVSTDAAPQGATCSIYAARLGKTGTSCHWAFPYRTAAANEFADVTWQEITACRVGQEHLRSGGVNHPDSYHLRVWESPQATYALSIKDKASLGQTFVFLRVERKPD